MTSYATQFRSVQTFLDRQKLYQDVVTKENHYRELFAQQRDAAELSDPFLMLVPVHDNEDIFKTVQETPEDEKIPKVLEQKNKLPAGTSTVVSKAEFLRNFDVFTEGSLKYLDWNNVIIAGGAVLGCLQPIPPEYNVDNKTRREYYHNEAYKSSDIDLFVYGLTEEQANEKLKQIFNAICDALPVDVIAFRSQHAITIVSQYPFRHIQIILRLYKSPAEVLMGFDVDCCSVAFDGSKVWMTPRCHRALVTQRNCVDLTRRSPSYESRLAKYSSRGFAVEVPSLQRGRIDPQLFERRFDKLQGLAKLLMLEKLSTPEARFRFKDSQRLKKLRPQYEQRGSFWSRLSSQFENDEFLKERAEDVGTDASDYSCVFFPWGPNWNAEKVRQLMFTKDMILNSSWYDPNKNYHTHPCFFGTIEDVLEDCCGNCPQHSPDFLANKDEDERKKLDEKTSPFVSGPLKWMTVDPGRQSIGSFHPITDGDWTEGAYISAMTERVCAAVNADDALTLQQLIADGVKIEVRDALGRTPLIIAAFCNSVDCCKVLLNAGAWLAPRTSDGRTALHIAAQYGHDKIVKLLLERGAVVKANKEKEKLEKEQREKEKAKAKLAEEAKDKEMAESEENGKAKKAAKKSKAAKKEGSDDEMDEDAEEEGEDENEEEEEEGEEEGEEEEKDSGDVDWTEIYRNKKRRERQAKLDAIKEAEEREDGPTADDFDVNWTDWDVQMTALMYAAFYGWDACVKLLLDQGKADLSKKLTYKDSDKVTAEYTLLELCMLGNRVSTARLLLEKGANINQLNHKDQTPLYIAVECNLVDFVRLFVDWNKDERKPTERTLKAADDRSDSSKDKSDDTEYYEVFKTSRSTSLTKFMETKGITLSNIEGAFVQLRSAMKIVSNVRILLKDKSTGQIHPERAFSETCKLLGVTLGEIKKKSKTSTAFQTTTTKRQRKTFKRKQDDDSDDDDSVYNVWKCKLQPSYKTYNVFVWCQNDNEKLSSGTEIIVEKAMIEANKKAMAQEAKQRVSETVRVAIGGGDSDNSDDSSSDNDNDDDDEDYDSDDSSRKRRASKSSSNDTEAVDTTAPVLRYANIEHRPDNTVGSSHKSRGYYGYSNDEENDSKYGSSMLYLAVSNNNKEIVQILLEAGASPEQQPMPKKPKKADDTPKKPKHARYQSWRYNRYARNTSKPEDYYINTIEQPLFAAVTKGYADIVDLLLKHGANKNTLHNNRTPLDVVLDFIKQRDNEDKKRKEREEALKKFKEQLSKTAQPASASAVSSKQQQQDGMGKRKREKNYAINDIIDAQLKKYESSPFMCFVLTEIRRISNNNDYIARSSHSYFGANSSYTVLPLNSKRRLKLEEEDRKQKEREAKLRELRERGIDINNGEIDIDEYFGDNVDDSADMDIDINPKRRKQLEREKRTQAKLKAKHEKIRELQYQLAIRIRDALNAVKASRFQDMILTGRARELLGNQQRSATDSSFSNEMMEKYYESKKTLSSESGVKPTKKEKTSATRATKRRKVEQSSSEEEDEENSEDESSSQSDDDEGDEPLTGKALELKEIKVIYQRLSNRESTAVIPVEEQPKYQEFFDAVFAKDINKVKELTINAPIGKQVHVCCMCQNLQLSPVQLALLMDNVEMARTLIEIACAQYTGPDPELLAKKESEAAAAATEAKEKRIPMINNRELAATFEDVIPAEYLSSSKRKKLATGSSSSAAPQVAADVKVNCVISPTRLLMVQNPHTLLVSAVRQGNTEAVRMLLDDACKMVSDRLVNLGLEKIPPYRKLVRFLITVDNNAHSYNHRLEHSLLEISAGKGLVDMARLLLEHGLIDVPEPIPLDADGVPIMPADNDHNMSDDEDDDEEGYVGLDVDGRKSEDAKDYDAFGSSKRSWKKVKPIRRRSAYDSDDESDSDDDDADSKKATRTKDPNKKIREAYSNFSRALHIAAAANKIDCLKFFLEGDATAAIQRYKETRKQERALERQIKEQNKQQKVDSAQNNKDDAAKTKPQDKKELARKKEEFLANMGRRMKKSKRNRYGSVPRGFVFSRPIIDHSLRKQKPLKQKPLKPVNPLFDLMSVDSAGRTALFYAVEGNARDAVQTLLEYAGRYHTLPTSLDKTPQPDIVAKFVNMPDNTKATALHLAVAHSAKMSIIKILMDNGADLAHTGSQSGFTPLHFAAQNNDLKRLQGLVECYVAANKSKSNFNPNIINVLSKANESIAMIAARKGRPGLLRALLNQTVGGTIDLDVQNKNGDTALHIACKASNIKCAQILTEAIKLRKQANSSAANQATLLNDENYVGLTPLDCGMNNMQSNMLVNANRMIRNYDARRQAKKLKRAARKVAKSKSATKKQKSKRKEKLETEDHDEDLAKAIIDTCAFMFDVARANPRSLVSTEHIRSVTNAEIAKTLVSEGLADEDNNSDEEAEALTSTEDLQDYAEVGVIHSSSYRVESDNEDEDDEKDAEEASDSSSEDEEDDDEELTAEDVDFTTPLPTIQNNAKHRFGGRLKKAPRKKAYYNY